MWVMWLVPSFMMDWNVALDILIDFNSSIDPCATEEAQNKDGQEGVRLQSVCLWSLWAAAARFCKFKRCFAWCTWFLQAAPIRLGAWEPCKRLTCLTFRPVKSLMSKFYCGFADWYCSIFISELSVLEEAQQEAWTGQRALMNISCSWLFFVSRFRKVLNLMPLQCPCAKHGIFQVDLPVTDRLPFNIFVLATNARASSESEACTNVAIVWRLCRSHLVSISIPRFLNILIIGLEQAVVG